MNRTSAKQGVCDPVDLCNMPVSIQPNFKDSSAGERIACILCAQRIDETALTCKTRANSPGQGRKGTTDASSPSCQARDLVGFS